LVKDYCINNNPDKTKNIKKESLSDCIKNYIDDANIKNCAELATWLGNDETHYERRWETKDIKDLKILIDLTVIFIQSRALAEQYTKDMKGEGQTT